MCSHPGTVFASAEKGLAIECPVCGVRSPEKPSAKEADEAWEAIHGPRGVREQIRANWEERCERARREGR